METLLEVLQWAFLLVLWRMASANTADIDDLYNIKMTKENVK